MTDKRLHDWHGGPCRICGQDPMQEKPQHCPGPPGEITPPSARELPYPTIRDAVDSGTTGDVYVRAPKPSESTERRMRWLSDLWSSRTADYLFGCAAGMFVHWFLWDRPDLIVRPIVRFLWGSP